MTDNKDKIIQIAQFDNQLVVLTKKGRIFQLERKFTGTTGYYPPEWKEIALPDLSI